MRPDEQSSERLTMALDACLDLRAAAALKSDLLQGLAMAKPPQIDAGGVTRISTATIQVLTAFIAAAENAGNPLVTRNPSSVFETAFANLGLDGILGGAKTRDQS